MPTRTDGSPAVRSRRGRRRATPSRRICPPALWALLAGALLGGDLPTAAPASAQELHVDREGPRSVRFISRAPMEEFEGRTDRIDGYVMIPGGVREGQGFDGSALYMEVDLASLETGIGLRDRHMRENYLETDRHPYASYEARVDRIEATGDGRYVVSASGDLTIHGVTRPLDVPCTVGASIPYAVSCSFAVRLSDHDIEIPRVMFLKLADEVRLELSFLLVEAGAS